MKGDKLYKRKEFEDCVKTIYTGDVDFPRYRLEKLSDEIKKNEGHLLFHSKRSQRSSIDFYQHVIKELKSKKRKNGNRYVNNMVNNMWLVWKKSIDLNN